ncbi:alpha/beta hydrolase [Emcibacter nanhaiensis]|uniref:Alpha/beta hydrolase n=1 Tax=Emcibacter nanhaiensis TaxID=1505037 RepID=A0A501PFY6_9PROT|nr:alpha/beta hydrolase [Emcibacter nanhaiensis]TPD59350.1 alpha/beta hydrolase [Emcibacter nanhaiensis]
MSTITNLSGPRVEPPAGTKIEKLVILSHGYGSNGYDLIGLVPHLQRAMPNAVFISPNAPEACPGAPLGYQWFGLTSLSREERLEGTLRAAPVLDNFINQELDRYGLEDKDLVLSGFSQGTMMSLHVGLRRKNTPAGILGFSGAMTLPDDWQQDVTAKPPVMLIHGDMDDVLPIQMMYDAKEALKSVGINVETHISRGITHSIGPDGLQKALEFLQKVDR